MTAASPLGFPGGRILATWWKQLAAWQPRSFWVAHLFLHRLEALSRIRKAWAVEPLLAFVLRALHLGPSLTPEALDGRLHLGVQAVRRLLSHLQAEGLAESGPDGSWQLTAAGRGAQEQGRYPKAGEERRQFLFLECEAEAGSTRYLPADLTPGAAGANAASAPPFDLRVLRSCLEQSPEWKERHGFPLDVEEIHFLDPEGETSNGIAPWQRVIVDRPERLTAVLVQPDSTTEDSMLAFGVQQENWAMQTSRPLFQLGPDWPEVFPELARRAGDDLLRQAWRTWCQPRGLPQADVEACGLTHQDHRLRVTAPARLVERLRAARSDIVKGEAWVLVGMGRIREALLLDLQEGEGASKPG
jgi:hypothetical protein